jgi:hypothetical protein
MEGAREPGSIAKREMLLQWNRNAHRLHQFAMATQQVFVSPHRPTKKEKGEERTDLSSLAFHSELALNGAHFPLAGPLAVRPHMADGFPDVAVDKELLARQILVFTYILRFGFFTLPGRYFLIGSIHT